jgi:hypothetical protein
VDLEGAEEEEEPDETSELSSESDGGNARTSLKASLPLR